MPKTGMTILLALFWQALPYSAKAGRFYNTAAKSYHPQAGLQ